MPRIIEPELLETFLAIAETGRFTQAAKRVHRTQSAVSMQMKRLEAVIGRPLFERDGRLLRLSDDGEVLLGHARRVLRAHQQALAAFSPSELSGSIRIGSPDEYAISFLPRILTDFTKDHPLVHVEVVCKTSERLLEEVNAGALDIILCTHGYAPDNEGVELFSEPLVWVSCAAHDVHEQRPIPLALFHPGCRFRDAALHALAKSALDYRVSYTSMSLSGIEAAVAGGLAVAVLPRANVRDSMRVLGPEDGYPALPDYQIAMHRAAHATSLVHDRLDEQIRARFRQASAAGLVPGLGSLARAI